MKNFETSLEMGMKALLILKEVNNQNISLERIVFYDSFTYKSKNHQERQLNKLLRRVYHQDGVDLMLSRGLLDVKYTEMGVLYQANSKTTMFVNLLESNYALKYQKKINKIVFKYLNYSDEEIQQIME